MFDILKLLWCRLMRFGHLGGSVLNSVYPKQVDVLIVGFCNFSSLEIQQIYEFSLLLTSAHLLLLLAKV